MYTFIRKRRKEAVTDYARRVRLLKGGKNRLVIRRSNRGIIAQAVKYSVDGDMTVSTARSEELSKLGLLGVYLHSSAYYVVYKSCLGLERASLHKSVEALVHYVVYLIARLQALEYPPL